MSNTLYELASMDSIGDSVDSLRALDSFSEESVDEPVDSAEIQLYDLNPKFGRLNVEEESSGTCEFGKRKVEISAPIFGTLRSVWLNNAGVKVSRILKMISES